jgi:ferredoxin--NADP+ reductase
MHSILNINAKINNLPKKPDSSGFLHYPLFSPFTKLKYCDIMFINYIIIWRITMFEIVNKKSLNPTVTMMDIKAPLVAAKAEPGQFIILRVDGDGERIPLTVAGYDRAAGTVKIIFQVVGSTTEKLNRKNAGDFISDFAGPLGVPTETEGIKNVCIVGGGVGCAIALPVAQKFHELGCNVTSVIGFRNKDLLILEDEFRAASDELHIMTDDGSYGREGNVCVPLNEMFAAGKKFDKVITIGPLIMMKFVVMATKPTGIPCDVSMNPIMIDGTGMCGGCRLTLNVDGKRVTKFACVDGPDFNGYQVDFDEAISRGSMYSSFERKKHEETCNLFKKEAK